MTERPELPVVEHHYLNHHLDSARWDDYQPRPTDVIVTTSYKSGTTFTQQILQQLLYGHLDPVPEISELSPWIDSRFNPVPLGQIYAGLEKMEGQRFIKSHLPLDGLPYYEEVKYLIVGRDPRDVFMSFQNHYSNYSDLVYQMMNAGEGIGDDLPRINDDVHELWRDWISRGWFKWESEGYPFWSNMHHTQTYWNYRHLPNFMFIHYADMLSDLDGAVRRIAAFIGVDPDDKTVSRVVEETTFANVKKKAQISDEEKGDENKMIFKGGQDSFFFKGTNGRWKDVLTEADLELYHAARARVLTPDCAAWLEQGGIVEA